MVSLIFGIQNSTLAVVGALTGVASWRWRSCSRGLISPRSFNPQKGEAYECGIPTRGESMAQFHIGYYLWRQLCLISLGTRNEIAGHGVAFEGAGVISSN